MLSTQLTLSVSIVDSYIPTRQHSLTHLRALVTLSECILGRNSTVLLIINDTYLSNICEGKLQFRLELVIK